MFAFLWRTFQSRRLLPGRFSLLQCAGIVITGRFSRGLESAIVNSIIINENTCLDSRSVSSIQNQ